MKRRHSRVHKVEEVEEEALVEQHEDAEEPEPEAADDVENREMPDADDDGEPTAVAMDGDGGGAAVDEGAIGEAAEDGDDAVNGDAPDAADDSVSKQPNPALIPAKKTQHKPGVCYLSRLPPHMTPQQLRDLLNYQGRVTRVYATPEPEHIRKKRKQKGGNNKINYTEAWVEFERRAIAKRVAAALNNTQIGGPRRAFYHDDLWNIKYLKKFTWHHLTEKMRYEKRVREQRLRSEVALAKRETNAYLEQVQKAKVAKKIEERKALKAQKGEGATKESIREEKKVDTKLKPELKPKKART